MESKLEENKEYEYINEFIEPIIRKTKRHDFFAWLRLKRVLRRITFISPDFDTLYKIWQLVYFANICYMISYNENINLHLFLGAIKNRLYRDAHVMIYKEKYFSFTFILEPNLRKINIEIDRSDGSSRKDTEKISFIDGEYEFVDKFDEEKFGYIVPCLMGSVKELIVYLYNNKIF